MAKVLCDSLSAMTFAEQCDIAVDNKEYGELVTAALESNGFWSNLPELLSIVYALGGGTLRAYLDNGAVRIDYIPADRFVPVRWDGRRVTEAIFVSATAKENDFYTLLKYQKPGRSEFKLFRSDSDKELGTEIRLSELYPELSPVVEYGTDDEELYHKVCKQRELERKVRKSKTEADMLEAAGDFEGAKAVRQKAATQNKELKAYCQQNELKYRTNRVRTYGAVAPKKTLDKSSGSGIIKVGSEEMYRKNVGFKIEPMPKKQLQRIVKRFKEHGGIIQFDEATDVYLEGKNAEAITYNATTILLRRNAGRASIFEELIHATQYRNGENDGTYLSRLKCEIAAQKKLIKYSKAYKLTRNEIIQTKNALAAYEKELDEYIKNGGA